MLCSLAGLRPARSGPQAGVNPGDAVELTPEGNRLIAHQQRHAHRRCRAPGRGPSPEAHRRRQQVRRGRHPRSATRTSGSSSARSSRTRPTTGRSASRPRPSRPTCARTPRAPSCARRWISRRTSRTTRRTTRSRTSIASSRPSHDRRGLRGGARRARRAVPLAAAPRTARAGPAVRTPWPDGRASSASIAAMTGRGPPSTPDRATRCPSSTARARAAARLVTARIEAHTAPGDVVADLVRPGRLGRPGGARPPAPGLARIEAAHPAARRGRPAAARRPPSRRRVPGHRRVAPARIEPQGARSATCSRPAARRAAGRSSSTRSSGRSDDEADDRRAGSAPVTRHYRCTVCRDQRGGGGAAPGAARRRRPRRATADVGPPRSARRCRDRFPAVDGAATSSTSCSTCTRRASSSGSARSSSASRATCGRRR